MDSAELFKMAQTVLADNDRDGLFTIPTTGLYPHQWLWDSCFIAIGIRHYDVPRAQQEILSLLRGQWGNGMLPHMIFSPHDAHRIDREVWRSYVSPYAPDGVATSGITQPPMVAEAVVRIGQKLGMPERRSWYQRVYPALLAYHQWMYNDRDLHQEGLTVQIHSWETGMDDTPPWLYEMHQHLMPLWIRALHNAHLDGLLSLFRRDTHYVPRNQRMKTIDHLVLYSIQKRLRRKAYDTERILSHSLLSIEDLNFNAILIRANHHLRSIAKTIGQQVPDDLHARMKKTEGALEQLWDAYSGQYYCRNFVTHKLLKVPTIATLMPLYAGSISKERAAQLVGLLKSKAFWPKFPVPSVPVTSEGFHAHTYWQGPVWINMNWLIIDGLQRYGYTEEAEHIAKQTLKLVGSGGCHEYFSPLDGSPAGANNFSWTAALTIDLLKTAV
jgi:hypothetical protein